MTDSTREGQSANSVSSTSSTPKSSQESLPRCPLYDIVQYACQPHFNYHPTTGERLKGGTVTCYPLPRIFRKCQGIPAVDVSRVIYENDGLLPLDQSLPKGQPWGQVRPKKTDPFRLNH
ncbi:Mitochondrial export protein Som1 [Phaffia rhodozyma]|uniref:Mitochondrial export protein Som1 n=1 Tax=Phaffia rhodozyma TaxID=264483 RepID=A0A0F7SL20_PHARH|nr:Mitochondrial export protein Som1 [Phaffia rhodozyma]